jgi:hypothetical protein
MVGYALNILFPPLAGAISAVIVFRVLNHLFGWRYARRQALAHRAPTEQNQLAASF